MQKINSFISKLAAYENTPQTFNPYKNQLLANNLGLYLNSLFETVKNPVLLVGEAPGYKGCKLTGIPFTSGKVFENPKHKLLKFLKTRLILSEIDSENTATIVWEYLTRTKRTPLFWNSFPFHPHPKDNLDKNRAPTKEEITVGAVFLRELYDIFQPVAVAGIGIKGADCACRCFPEMDINMVRHPSFGGKKDFIKGMNKLYRGLGSKV